MQGLLTNKPQNVAGVSLFAAHMPGELRLYTVLCMLLLCSAAINVASGNVPHVAVTL